MVGPHGSGKSMLAARVMVARDIQTERYRAMGLDNIRCNAEVDGEALEEVAGLDKAGKEILSQAIEVMRLTARGYHRILRVARTLADLEGCEKISKIHISEALSYRQKRHFR